MGRPRPHGLLLRGPPDSGWIHFIRHEPLTGATLTGRTWYSREADPLRQRDPSRPPVDLRPPERAEPAQGEGASDRQDDAPNRGWESDTTGTRDDAPR
eukprot:152417-Alexandrium_andersonii.AAC.1